MIDIKKFKLEHLIIVLIPLINQLQVGGFVLVENIIYLPMIIFLLVFFVHRNELFLENKNIAFIYVIIQFIFPLVFFRIANRNCVLAICLNFLSFFLIMYYSDFRNSKISFNELVALFFIGNSLILIYNIITHLQEIQLSNLSMLLDGVRNKDRSKMGFYHANWLAMYSFMEIVLLVFMIKLRKFNRYIFALFLLLCFLAIISSGSRTAFICSFLFLLSQLGRYIFSKIGLGATQYFIQIGIVVVLLMYMFQTESASELVELSSGRDILNKTTIDYLRYNGYLYFGYAPFNYTELAKYVPLTDCWYVVCIAQIGIVGLLGWVSIIIILAYKIIKSDNFNGVTLLVCLLCYGATENVVFNPGVSLSIVFLVLIFYSANNMNSIYEMEKQNES